MKIRYSVIGPEGAVHSPVVVELIPETQAEQDTLEWLDEVHKLRHASPGALLSVNVKLGKLKP